MHKQAVLVYNLRGAELFYRLKLILFLNMIKKNMNKYNSRLSFLMFHLYLPRFEPYLA